MPTIELFLKLIFKLENAQKKSTTGKIMKFPYIVKMEENCVISKLKMRNQDFIFTNWETLNHSRFLSLVH